MVERITNLIYWTVFSIVTVFEIAVIVTLFALMLIPACAILLVFFAVWEIFQLFLLPFKLMFGE